MPAYNVTWFLRALFMFVLVSPVVKIVVSRKQIGYISLSVIFCLHMFATIYHITSLEALEWFFPIKGLFYFSLGAYMACHGLSLNNITTSGVAACGAISLTLMIYAAFFQVFPIWMVVVAHPLMILFLWRFTPSKPWPKSLTDKGFALYLLHPLFVFAIGRLSLRVGFVAQMLNSVAGNLLLAMLVVMASIIAAYAICGFAPILTKPLFGGRC